LFGDTSLKKSVKVVNSVIKEYPFKIIYKDDPTIVRGKQVVDQKGTNGYRVTSKMLIYVNGNLIETKQLPASYYKPLDQVVLVGTKPVSQKPVTGDQASGGNSQTGGSGEAGGNGTQPATPPTSPDPPASETPHPEQQPENGWNPAPQAPTDTTE